VLKGAGGKWRLSNGRLEAIMMNINRREKVQGGCYNNLFPLEPIKHIEPAEA
jgi:hypothetical protein